MSKEAIKYHLHKEYGIERSLLDRIERVAESCRSSSQKKVAERYACLAAKKIINTKMRVYDRVGFLSNEYENFCNDYMRFIKDLFGDPIKCREDSA